MNLRSDRAKLEPSYMGFEIRDHDGWYVGLLGHGPLWKMFEAESRLVLEYEIHELVGHRPLTSARAAILEHPTVFGVY